MVSETIILAFSGILMIGLTCFIAGDSMSNPLGVVSLSILFILGTCSFGYAVVDVIRWALRMKKGKGKGKDDSNNRNGS